LRDTRDTDTLTKLFQVIVIEVNIRHYKTTNIVSGRNWFGSAAAEANQFRPDPARKLSTNVYHMYHCCVYSEKLLTTDRGTVRNM